jgi:hypothetical protein
MIKQKLAKKNRLNKNIKRQSPKKQLSNLMSEHESEESKTENLIVPLNNFNLENELDFAL